jgi:hypothetical protein
VTGNLFISDLPFLFRLDFWADLVDVLGLAVLVSWDVEFLKPLRSILLHLPSVRRRAQLMSRLHQKTVSFIQSFPNALHAERLETLNGVEIVDFLRCFPNWQRNRATPEAVDVCAVNFDPNLQSVKTWIYAAEVIHQEMGQPRPHQLPIAGILPAEELSSRAEKLTQNLVYTTGFALMGFASLLSLIQIAIDRH